MRGTRILSSILLCISGQHHTRRQLMYCTAYTYGTQKLNTRAQIARDCRHEYTYGAQKLNTRIYTQLLNIRTHLRRALNLRNHSSSFLTHLSVVHISSRVTVHASPVELPILPRPAVSLSASDDTISSPRPPIPQPLSVVQEILAAGGEHASTMSQVLTPVTLSTTT